MKIRTRPFDMASYLGSEEEVAEYLRQVLEDGAPAELAAALGDVAHAVLQAVAAGAGMRA